MITNAEPNLRPIAESAGHLCLVPDLDSRAATTTTGADRSHRPISIRAVAKHFRDDWGMDPTIRFDRPMSAEISFGNLSKQRPHPDVPELRRELQHLWRVLAALVDGLKGAAGKVSRETNGESTAPSFATLKKHIDNATAMSTNVRHITTDRPGPLTREVDAAKRVICAIARVRFKFDVGGRISSVQSQRLANKFQEHNIDPEDGMTTLEKAANDVRSKH